MASQSSSVEFLSANTRTWHGSKESTKSIARVGRKDESLRSVRSIPVHDFRSHPRPKLPASHLCLGSLGRVAVLKFHTEVWAGRGSLVESSSCRNFLVYGQSALSVTISPAMMPATKAAGLVHNVKESRLNLNAAPQIYVRLSADLERSSDTPRPPKSE